jgi:hypothetical protein
MDVFDNCSKINDLLQVGKDVEARSELIQLLDRHKKGNIPYSPLVNHLIRGTGLFPYIEPETSTWQDRFAYESFKVNIGLDEEVTLHSEQSLVLKCLLEGESLAVSAPTSFGKSLIIDAFIAIKRPTNILIIVPTIALTDETRRRLSRKYSNEYKIVTTADVELAGKNIFIFPQERAIHYCDKIESLDLFVVDEFYKASKEFDKERAPALLKAMLKLGGMAKQRYYLAPNIAHLNESTFTKGMRFLPLDFNTVFLAKHDLYKKIKKDATKKSECLIDILNHRKAKSLIYAGTYANVDRVSTLLLERTHEIESELLANFSTWLAKNYDPNWKLTGLVKRGTGIHTGQLHRSLSQIQVRLFEEEDGLHNIVSTSSIIEGVNTSAENVIVWSNKNGKLLLKDFAYRNIIGRGGRMFKHFIGNIYILEEPPKPADTQLDLTFPDELLADVDEKKYKQDLTKEQIAKIIFYKEQMTELLGKDVIERIQGEGTLMTSDMSLIRDIALDIHHNQNQWRGLGFLNSPEVENWEWILHKVIKLSPAGWDGPHGKFVQFIKILSRNWDLSIPSLLDQLDPLDLGIEQFFKLEKSATFKLTALLNDVNVLQKEILVEKNIDISPFIAKLSRAFLPSCVFELEEYGLPRMISKKIHAVKLMNFLDEELTLHGAIEKLNALRDVIPKKVPGLDAFDKYVLAHFYEGIGKE